MQLRAVTKFEKQFQVDEEWGKHESFRKVISTDSLVRNVEPTSDDIVEQSWSTTLREPMTKELSDPRHDLNDDGIPDAIGTVSICRR